MKTQILQFVATLVVSSFATLVQATTYYVSTTGNDSNDGLSPATAWARIDRGQPVRLNVAHAAGVTVLTNRYYNTGFLSSGTLKIDSETINYISKTDNTFTLANPTVSAHAAYTFIYDNTINGGAGFVPGDIIEVQSGVYLQQANLYTMATSADPLTIRANGTVVVDGEGVRPACFYLFAGAYITIDGFNITGATTAGVLMDQRVSVGTHAYRIVNCNIYANSGHGIHGYFVYNYKHTTPQRIENCNIIGNGLDGCYGRIAPLAVKNCNIIGNRFGIRSEYTGSYGIAYVSNNCFYANAINLYTDDYPNVARNTEEEINGLVFSGVSAENIVNDPRFADLYNTNFNYFYEDSPCFGAADDGGNTGPYQNPDITLIPFSDKTYYVNNTTGDDARTDTESQNDATPWKTISRAVSSATGGDTVIVAEGSYSGGLTITNSGARDAPIHIIGQGTPIINASGFDYGVSIERSTGIKFEGFFIRDSNIAGIAIRDSGYGNLLQSVSSSNNAYGILSENSYGNSLNTVKLLNNTINGIRMIKASCFMNNSVVSMNTQAGIYADGVHGLSVTNSDISSNQDGIYSLSSTFNTYAMTDIHHNSRFGAYNGGYGSEPIPNIIDSCNIYRNGNAGVIAPSIGSFWLVVNSNVYSNESHGLAAGTNARDLDIQNCTIYGNNGSGIYNSHYISNQRQNIVNNLIANNARYGVEEASTYSGGRIDCSYNLFFDNTLGNYYDIDTAAVRNTAAEINADPNCLTNIVSNPLFRNNFRLQPSSPCIDSGTSDPTLLAAPATHDRVGTPRPAGAEVDIGSYEFPDNTGSILTFF